LVSPIKPGVFCMYPGVWTLQPAWCTWKKQQVFRCFV